MDMGEDVGRGLGGRGVGGNFNDDKPLKGLRSVPLDPYAVALLMIA